MRDVIWEVRAELVVDAACERYAPWMAEVVRSVEWRLSRQPHLGRPVPEHESFLLFKQDPWHELNIPGILVLYIFTDEQVVIHEARILDPLPQ